MTSDYRDTADMDKKSAEQPQPDAQAGPAIVDSVVLATAGYDHTVKCWSIRSGSCTRTHQHPGSHVNCMKLFPDASSLLTGGYQIIRMYDLKESNVNAVMNFENVVKNVLALGIQNDGRWMYSGGEDATVKIWDLNARNLHCQRNFTNPSKAAVHAVSLHPNQQELLIGDALGCIYVWNLVHDKSHLFFPEKESPIQSIDIDKNGKWLAALTRKGDCYIWRLDEINGKEFNHLKPRYKIPAHTGYGLRCKFSPDGSLFATTSADRTCKLWRVSDDFALAHELTCDPQKWVWDCAFTKNSDFVLTASSDGVARIWSTKTGALKKEFQGHQKALTALAFADEIVMK